MLLSVVIPTHSRAKQLERLLLALLDAPKPDDLSLEMVIVCSACTDDTRATVAEVARASSVPIRAIEQPRPGVALARNTGARAAAGGLVLFIDDDVESEPNLFVEIARALRSHPEVDIFAGEVVPLWKEPMPAWVAKEEPLLLRGALVVRHSLGQQSREYRLGDHMPLTANFWFKREAFDRLGGFNEKLRRMGDDYEFCLRALKSGLRMRFWPSAVVHHPVYTERARRGFLLRWYLEAGWGWGDYYRGPDDERQLFNVPRWLAAETMSEARICLRPRTWFDKTAVIYHQNQLAYRLAQTVSIFLHRLRRRLN